MAAAAGDAAAAYEIATALCRRPRRAGEPGGGGALVRARGRAGPGAGAIPLGSLLRKGPGREEGPREGAAGSIWRPPRKATPRRCTISPCSTPRASTASRIIDNAAQWFQQGRRRTASPTASTISASFMRAASASTKNLAESYKWFALAAAQGDKEAGKKRDDVARPARRRRPCRAPRSAVEDLHRRAAAGGRDHGAGAGRRLGRRRGAAPHAQAAAHGAVDARQAVSDSARPLTAKAMFAATCPPLRSIRT